MNSAVKIIYDGVTLCLIQSENSHMIQYENSSYQDTSPGISVGNLWMRTKILHYLVITVFFMQPVCLEDN